MRHVIAMIKALTKYVTLNNVLTFIIGCCVGHVLLHSNEFSTFVVGCSLMSAVLCVGMCAEWVVSLVWFAFIEWYLKRNR